MHNKEKILLAICILCLLLFLKQSRVLDRGTASTDNPLNTSPIEKSVDNTNPENAASNKLDSTSVPEKDYLGMSLEELMQIPAANNNSLLDKSIEELMDISVTVTDFTSKQQQKT